MTVRAATIGDATSIAEAEVVAWQATYPGLIDQVYLDRLDVARSARRWRGAFLDDISVLVAEAQGRVVGFISFGPAADSFDADRVSEVYSLFVHPSHWRAGHGRRLLRTAVAEMREAGFRSAILWVLPGNESARRFYEVQGWRADGVEEVGSLGGQSVPHVRYSLVLGGATLDNSGGPVS